MVKKQELLELINWESSMAQPRYAGGHDDVMTSIFDGNAKVLNHWNENYWQGAVATAWEFPDGSVVIMTDYYGSCSGCDAWEGASDSEARSLITNIVTSSRVFDNIDEARNFCQDEKDGTDYPFEAAANLKF